MTQEEAHIKNLSRELYEFCKERSIPMLVMVQLGGSERDPNGFMHSAVCCADPKCPRNDQQLSDQMFAFQYLAWMCRRAASWCNQLNAPDTGSPPC